MYVLSELSFKTSMADPGPPEFFFNVSLTSLYFTDIWVFGFYSEYFCLILLSNPLRVSFAKGSVEVWILFLLHKVIIQMVSQPMESPGFISCTAKWFYLLLNAILHVLWF